MYKHYDLIKIKEKDLQIWKSILQDDKNKISDLEQEIKELKECQK